MMGGTGGYLLGYVLATLTLGALATRGWDRSFVWMALAMAGLAVEDMFLKSAGGTLPVAQVMIIFGAGGAIVFALLARTFWQARQWYQIV